MRRRPRFVSIEIDVPEQLLGFLQRVAAGIAYEGSEPDIGAALIGIIVSAQLAEAAHALYTLPEAPGVH